MLVHPKIVASMLSQALYLGAGVVVSARVLHSKPRANY